MAEPAAPSPLQNPGTWSAVARGYAEEIVPLHEAVVAEALERVPLQAGDRVLDIATGPGTLAFVAARKARSVEAVDFASGMIAEVKARAQREAVTNVAATVMDAQALAFPNDDFDAAFCMFGFMFFPDRPRVFREIQRVVRRGGRLLIATWATLDRRPLMKLGFDALGEALPDLPPPQKGDLQTPEECVRELG
jgi:ubiquinone/menaquinone biosynthesis C-methylase UbiE